MRRLPLPAAAAAGYGGAVRTILAVAVALSALASGSALAGTPTQDLGWLNQKRAANGIPAGIVLEPEWSARCAQHIEYLWRTETIAHAEDPASPWYTEAGNWAGTRAVLSLGATWTSTDFIWEYAPFHLVQLLAPQLDRSGIADARDYTCVTTWPGYTRPLPSADQVVTYPGNGTTIYPSMIAREVPTTPAEALGLRNPTGPHLYAFQWGPSLASGAEITIARARLIGPDGPVAVRWIDRSTPTVGLYLPAAAGIVVPVRPLARGAYTATVAFTNGVSRTWSFAAGITGTRRLRDVRVTLRARSATTRVVRVAGRLVLRSGRGVADASVGVRIASTERAALRTRADGRFAGAFIVRTGGARRWLQVTVHADDSAPRTYAVRAR